MSPAAASAHWHPFQNMSDAMAPLVLTDADGLWMNSSDGRRLLDATAGLWFCHAGYGRREIADAAHTQMLRMHAYSTFGDYSNEPAEVLADRLSEFAPGGPWKIMFTSGGSDSVETAVKYARRYWQALGRPERTVVLSRRDSYHGMHTAATQISGIPANRNRYGDLLPDTRLVARDAPQALEAAVGELGAERVAAFVCEPIIGAGGVRFPPAGHLQTVAEICRRHGVLFIVDEVTTGLGRTGTWFASQKYGVEPDLLLCAKGLTSGYLPLGAAWSTSASPPPSGKTVRCSATATPTAATPRRPPPSPTSTTSTTSTITSFSPPRTGSRVASQAPRLPRCHRRHPDRAHRPGRHGLRPAQRLARG
ncbi:aminotransferase class III-fold pyridoxal phosphate-dependent enzyme [Streptomyces sp. NPDC091215]|uniref:aminotransferase family protein n=1 Tax=Streptomyces sp. NPDC091215 TaxID=3155192 RepID=UPI0034385C8E